MKVTKKLFLVALLLSLILSIGAVTAQDNMTFEKSNLQDISTETINQDGEQSIPDGVVEEQEDFELKDGEPDIASIYSFSDIQDSINSAKEGDTIYLDGKEYSGKNTIIVNKTVTIVGGSESDQDSIATLDANKFLNIMKITADNVVIKGVKFINGNADVNNGERGGAIWWSGNNGYLTNSLFESNHAENTGGAIYLNGKNCRVEYCNFTDNDADLGGAIKLDGDNGSLNNCRFISNYARVSGGIGGNGRDIIINNSYFENNHADEWGGAVDFNNNVILSNSYFVKNSASRCSAVVVGDDSNVKNCTFINNSANGWGTLNMYGKDCVVNNCTFKDNSAGEGGAVRWAGKNGLLTNSSFINNSANNGGAFYNSFYIVNLTGNNFTNNSAKELGDILYIGSANSVISNNNFDNSNSDKYAIYLGSPDNVIEDNNFTNPEMGIMGQGSIIDVEDVIIGFIGSKISIPVYVHDSNGNSLKGSVSLSGYGSQTLVDGKAIFEISLPDSLENLTFMLSYGIKNRTFDVIVTNHSIVNITQPESDSDEVLVRLAYGAEGIVMITINGKNYAERVVNSSARIKIDALVNGDYNAIIYYSGDYNHQGDEKNITVVVKHNPVYNLSQNKDITVAYSGKTAYRVLVMKDGDHISGENVIISFNGKNHNVKTDANGYATLNLDTNIKPGSYSVKTTYNGVSVSNKVKITQIIKASDKKVKKSAKTTKVKISLSKVDGKYLKSKTLKVKFNGKTYKVKTNSKGVGTWKVKKSMLKKLKVNKKYKYAVSYGKDTLTKKLIIRK
ncbi:MAG: hypothetical protein Q4Q37_06285 [Methanobrevibacter sp.]|nr:hypothetical protein [Methanobrevibacter sp.]